MLARALHNINFACFRVFYTGNQLRIYFDARQQFQHGFAATFTFYRENNGIFGLFNEAPQKIERIFVLRLNRELWQRLVAEVGVRRFFIKLVCFELNTWPLFERGKQFINAQPELVWREQRAHRVNAAVLVALIHIQPKSICRGL